MLHPYVYIAMGGALGAVSRYAVSNYLYGHMPEKVHYATLVINVVGSFLIGIMYVLIVERLYVHAHFQSGLMVGFLGAFTTFSTFSLETVRYLQAGQIGEALFYVAASVVFCVIACWIGISATRIVS